MKFINNVTFELDTMIGQKLNLTMTLIILDEAA